MRFPTVGMQVRRVRVELSTLISDGMGVPDSVPATVCGGYHVAVSSAARSECVGVGVTPDAVHIVAGCIMATVPAGVAARETEEGHGGHPGGAEDQGEDVEVQLTTR